MHERFARLAARAAANHGVVSLDDVRSLDVPSSTLGRWVRDGLLERLGPRSFRVAGAPRSWHLTAAAALADVRGGAALAGRSAAFLHGLDGFRPSPPELLLELPLRRNRTAHRVAVTSRPIPRSDVARVDGLRVLRVERLILDAPLFGFSRAEIENAIDSGIRARLVSEQRLRTRAVERHTRGINGGRKLLDSLVDTGGESRLERWFLRLVREANLPRPQVQRTFRGDGRTVARVDAFFPGNLVVELEGHGTHSSRRQRQRDEERRTALVLRGCRVLTFTYLDVRDRPQWVIARLREALGRTA
jgi:very-short-patch-repair endonuclease